MAKTSLGSVDIEGPSDLPTCDRFASAQLCQGFLKPSTNAVAGRILERSRDKDTELPRPPGCRREKTPRRFTLSNLNRPRDKTVLLVDHRHQVLELIPIDRLWGVEGERTGRILGWMKGPVCRLWRSMIRWNDQKLPHSGLPHWIAASILPLSTYLQAIPLPLLEHRTLSSLGANSSLAATRIDQ